jgi:hypothetical protein
MLSNHINETTKMKTEDYINQFIEREKQIEPNPFLGTRIMASIENPVTKRVNTWHTIIAVASISLVMFLGFELSTLYISTSTPNELSINDSHIEMFHFYQSDSHE